MSTDIRLSKAQISKIIQSRGFLGKTFGKLGKKVLLDLAIPLAKDVLPNLATIATSSVLDKFEKKKKNWTRSSKSRKWTHFIISNEDEDDIIKIAESSEKSFLLIDGARGTVNMK